jgi:hypothetical protein
LTSGYSGVIIAEVSFKSSFWLTVILSMMAILLGASTVPVSDELSRLRAFTLPMEFDYVSWTARALAIKFGQFSLGTSSYLLVEDQTAVVLSELDLISQISQLESQVNELYTDPSVRDPKSASVDLRRQISELQAQRDQLEPVAESILQAQLNDIASQMGLTFAGQALPPVLFHITPPPDALIVSPRDVIRQDFNISISPDITVDQMDALENQVDQSLNVSSLVVGIGGIGLYPTMVEQTTDINALAEVIAHEWVHNYLTLRPLGVSYENSPALRTMNETVATIAGKELGRALVQKYYPAFLAPEAPPSPPAPESGVPAPAPVFDFNAEMHLTRVNTDKLLAAGKVDVAETYMELRRQFLWDNGYHIRKINQAYFAFYGAYADQPAGAAGVDPVGAAVRLLREKSVSLAQFINRIAWMWNFDQLKAVVGSQ